MPANLPETLDEFGIRENDIKEFYGLYTKWVALERRYPPDVLLQQPERILSFFIAMDNLNERLAKIKDNEKLGII